MLRFRDIAVAQDGALLAAGLPAPGADALYGARLTVHKACHDRVRAGPGEVRHGEVVGGVRTALALPATADAILAAAEIAYEAGAVRADGRLTSLLRIQAAGKPVVFVSDMYLSGADVRRILVAVVPALADLPLFVSADVGLTKRHGHLFAHVAAALDLPPDAVLHVGDNPHADVLRAREAGFRTLWRPRPWWWRRTLAVRDRLVRRRLRRAGTIRDG